MALNTRFMVHVPRFESSWDMVHGPCWGAFVHDRILNKVLEKPTVCVCIYIERDTHI